MLKLILALTLMGFGGSALAHHNSDSGALVVAKQLTYALDELAAVATSDEHYAQYSPYASSAGLKNLAIKADKLATAVAVKVVKPLKYGSLSEAEAGFLKLSHDIKNLENAYQRVKTPSWDLEDLKAEVDYLLEELKEKLNARGGRNGRGGRVSTR